MGSPHLAALETTFTAEDWAGRIQVLSGIDGNVCNSNLPEDAPLAKVHLETESAKVIEPEISLLTVATVQSRIRIAMAARTRARDTAGHRVETAREPIVEPGYVGQQLELELTPHRPVTVEKVVAVVTSRDPAISEPARAALHEVLDADDFFELRLAHERAWARLWERFDIVMDASPDVILALRLHTFHLLQALSGHTAQLDVGVPARGLHGEGYHGHVFWDAMFAFPAINLHLPALSRALLLYRWRRLDPARRAARAAGHVGAMFPWQSASDGREETPLELFDLHTQRWVPDRSHLQRHIGISIVYDVWQYYQVTGDVNFLVDHGAELVVEIARYLVSITAYDAADQRYGIAGIVGPDEYHDVDPETGAPGLRDNAYTNVMTSWALRRVLEIIELLAGYHCGQLWEQLGISEAETQQWDHISRRMRVPFHDGVISQFAGYEKLAEFDWTGYRAQHDDFVGVDGILRARGDDPNRYKLSKQADVLMLFYLLSAEELRGDLADMRGGSTRHGIHLGAMAGTIDLVLRCYTGLETRGGVLYFNPRLPNELRALHAEILYRGHWLVIDVNHRRLLLALRPCQAPPITVSVNDDRHVLRAGTQKRFGLSQTGSNGLHMTAETGGG